MNNHTSSKTAIMAVVVGAGAMLLSNAATAACTSSLDANTAYHHASKKVGGSVEKMKDAIKRWPDDLPCTNNDGEHRIDSVVDRCNESVLAIVKVMVGAGAIAPAGGLGGWVGCPAHRKAVKAFLYPPRPALEHSSGANAWGLHTLDFAPAGGLEGGGVVRRIVHPTDGRSSTMTIRCTDGSNCGGAMLVECRFDLRGKDRGVFRFLRSIVKGVDVVIDSKAFEREAAGRWIRPDSTMGAARGARHDGHDPHDDLSCRVHAFGAFEGSIE